MGLRKQLGGNWVAVPQRELLGSTNATAQAQEHWAPGHSPGSGLPLGQAEARRAQDSKDTPALSQADQRPHPQSLQAPAD